MDNPPTCQSKPPQFNPNSYENQEILTNQLRSVSLASALPPMSVINAHSSPRRRRSLF